MNTISSQRFFIRLALGAILVLGIGLPILPALQAEENVGTVEPSLEDCMKALKKDLQSVQKQVNDAAQNAVSVQIVVEMEQVAMVAKGKTPHRLRALPVKEKSQALVAYRKRIVALIGELMKLEIAFLEDRNSDAGSILQQIIATQEAGHKQFAE